MSPDALSLKAREMKTRRRIAEDKVAIAQARLAVMAYTNENLKQSRKRKLGWQIPSKAERDFSRYDRNRSMAMARQRVEENPIYLAINKARLDHIVGTGFRLRMMTKDKGWNKAVEERWRVKRDQLDIRGLRSWGEWQRCFKSRLDVDGDLGIVLVNDPDLRRWNIQLIEGDRIGRLDPKSEMDDGLVYDSMGALVMAYVLDSPTDPKSEGSYTAKNFIFAMSDSSDRAERRRGVTRYLQTFNLGEDHADILDGMVQKVKNASFMGLKFNLKSPSNAFGGAGGTITDGGTDFSKVELRAGTNVLLSPDESVGVIESNTPEATFLPFEKALLSRLSFPVGMTYELVTGDFSDLNYTSGRAMLTVVRAGVRCEQMALALKSSRIFLWDLKEAVKAGELNPPSGLKDWANHKWGVPTFPYLNPAQEAAADKIRIETRTASRQSILAERGDEDIDDILDELEYESSEMQDRKISELSTPGSGGTYAPASPNDPAQH